MTTLTEITNLLRVSVDLPYCERLVAQINRDPKRKAWIKRDGLICQVVDDAIEMTDELPRCDAGYGRIVGWEK